MRVTDSWVKYVQSYICTNISLSACLLQRQSVDYSRVRDYSLRVLQWRPGDVKALYRAGVATLEMGDAETAKQYLAEACREQPNGKRSTQGSSTESLVYHLLCCAFIDHFRRILKSNEYFVPVGCYL